MQTHATDPLSLFRLAPLKAARVSEISETTASSAASPEDRVNFHIGNPVQDKRLTSAYLRVALGIDIRREDLSDDQDEQILRHLDWEQQNEPKLAFLKNLIHKSAPYTPRGGFARNNPHNLVKVFADWLQNQQEPLSYDLGQNTGRREIVLASGGVEESIRILFHALSVFLIERPAHVFLHRVNISVDERAYNGLAFEQLPEDDQRALGLLADHFARLPRHPVFLIMGAILGEETRRSLRQISLDSPLFFIEVNDAQNHLSLAREAKLTQRVVRILTPGIFSKNLHRLSTVFLVGNADILGIFESTHFQLKGTPSASEIELLSYLLQDESYKKSSRVDEGEIIVEPSYQSISVAGRHADAFPVYARLLDDRLGNYVDRVAESLENRIDKITGKLDQVAGKLKSFRSIAPFDLFAQMDASTFLDEVVGHIDSSEWQDELQQSLLLAFLKHHP